jgi:hypothetical protein
VVDALDVDQQRASQQRAEERKKGLKEILKTSRGFR